MFDRRTNRISDRASILSTQSRPHNLACPASRNHLKHIQDRWKPYYCWLWALLCGFSLTHLSSFWARFRSAGRGFLPVLDNQPTKNHFPNQNKIATVRPRHSDVCGPKMPKNIKTQSYFEKEGKTLFVLSPRIITMRALEDVVFQEKSPHWETPERECWFEQVFLIA